MRTRLTQFFDALRTGFWFVPSVMLALAGGLALLLLHIDRRFDPGLKSSVVWAYSGGPEGARSLLSTVAGSMITAASVTFSLASVALSIASQQYGSRVLRNFMRDRITQVLLGTFVSTFLYSVLVVRDIRGSDFSGGFVPAIAITVAIAMSLISLVMLVYFVHHVSSSIQASHIVSTISKDMQQAIPKLFPAYASEDAAAMPARLLSPRDGPSASVPAEESGYLQAIDTKSLLALAVKHSLFFEVLQKPGDHIVEQAPLTTLWGAPLTVELRKEIVDAFNLGPARTPYQDIRYQFQQLTDVICRALSPGINDPFTAVNGIDELATGLSLLGRRPRPHETVLDRDGISRLFVPHPRFEDILSSTIGHIAVYGAGDPFVMARLRKVLDIVEPSLQGPDEISRAASLRDELDAREKAKAVT
jgi:uncharacterized membrane protein